jgi:hypothetical protein
MAQYVENEDDSFARCKRNRKRLTWCFIKQMC